jgi:hypothetical protein
LPWSIPAANWSISKGWKGAQIASGLISIGKPRTSARFRRAPLSKSIRTIAGAASRNIRLLRRLFVYAWIASTVSALQQR